MVLQTVLGLNSDGCSTWERRGTLSVPSISYAPSLRTYIGTNMIFKDFIYLIN